MSVRRGEPVEDELLGVGILAMALTFAVFWLIFHFTSLKLAHDIARVFDSKIEDIFTFD